MRKVAQKYRQNIISIPSLTGDMTGGCDTRADMTARQAVVGSHVFNEIVHHTPHNVEYLTCANMLSHLGLLHTMDPTSAA